MDIQSFNSVDIVHDIEQVPWPLSSGCYDLAYSSHCLEHLHVGKVVPALMEFKRILKPAGMLELHVPDLARLVKFNDWNLAAPCIYGDQRGQYDYHRCGFWKKGFTSLLRSVGFVNILTAQTSYDKTWPELTVKCFKPPGLAQPWAMRSNVLTFYHKSQEVQK